MRKILLSLCMAVVSTALASVANATQPHWGFYMNQDTYSACGSGTITVEVYFYQYHSEANSYPADRIQASLQFMGADFDVVSVTRGSDVPANCDYLNFSSTCHCWMPGDSTCVRMEAWDDGGTFQNGGTYHWATVVLDPKRVASSMPLALAREICTTVTDCWNAECTEYTYETGMPRAWQEWDVAGDTATVSYSSSCGGGCPPPCELEKPIPSTAWSKIKALYK